MSDPTISIIIPVHNQCDATIRCFNSIYSVTKLPYEVIWVDNGSDKDNFELISRQAKLLGSKCKLIRNKTNEGFIKATNQGIAAAQSAYAILLNNDTEVTPTWETNLIKPLHYRPEVGCVGPITQSRISWQSHPYINMRWELGLPRYNDSIKLSILSEGFTNSGDTTKSISAISFSKNLLS